MLKKLDALKQKKAELEKFLSDPQILAEPHKYRQYSQEYARVSHLVKLGQEYKKLLNEIEQTRQLTADEDKSLRQLAEEELKKMEIKKLRLEKKIKNSVSGETPDDERNTIFEIRAGTGGEEAALFVTDLYKMYTRYIQRKGWKTELLTAHPTGLGGFKEIIFFIGGAEGTYGQLKYEGGVHRVQRVPVTESGGRIHTSAATVAVLPEAREVDLKINPADLKVDTFSSSAPGGQHVNRSYSAVRITHLPTGMVVSCQDERSQIKNRAKAMKVLYARLYAKAKKEQHQQIARKRKLQVGSGERSEKIRTYNFSQNRITDHRIGLSLHQLDKVLEGDLDRILEPLLTQSPK